MDYRDNQQQDLYDLYLDLGVLVRRISFLCHRCVTVVEVLDSLPPTLVSRFRARCLPWRRRF